MSASSWQPFELNGETFLNFRSLVWENDFAFQDRQEYPWQHVRQRLTYDRPQKMQRFRLGDLTPLQSGFLSQTSLGGISLTKNFLLQPSLHTTPSNEEEIFLEEPSKVEIYINDRARKTFDLPKGTHLLRNLQESAGRNEIELVITDKFNRIRRVRKNYLFDSSFLSPNLFQYDCYLGYRSSQKEGSLYYDTKDPVGGGFLRKSLLPWLSSAIYIQKDKYQFLTGNELLLASPWGKFSVDLGLSHINQSSTSHAERISFSAYPGTLVKDPSFSTLFSVFHQGKRFASFGDREPNNVERVKLLLGIAYPVYKKTVLTLSGETSLLYSSGHSPFQVSGTTSIPLKHDIECSLNMSIRRSNEGIYDKSAVITFSWKPGGSSSNQEVRSGYESNDRQKFIEYRKNGQKWGYEGEVSGQYISSIDSENISFDTGISGERFSTNLGYTFQETSGGESLREQSLNFSYSTALIFAEGTWGLSRPVHDSFCIAQTKGKIKNKEVFLNPMGESYLAKSFSFLPAAADSLQSYEPHLITVDVPDLPRGHDIGDNQFVIHPTYRSGSSIILKSDAVVMLQTYLKGSENNPLGLQAGKIISLDHPEKKPISFFTNKKGRLRALGLSPGNFQVVLFSPSYQPYNFSIPEGTEGIYKLEELRLPKK